MYEVGEKRLKKKALNSTLTVSYQRSQVKYTINTRRENSYPQTAIYVLFIVWMLIKLRTVYINLMHLFICFKSIESGGRHN